jgi:hypothetical protein
MKSLLALLVLVFSLSVMAATSTNDHGAERRGTLNTLSEVRTANAMVEEITVNVSCDQKWHGSYTCDVAKAKLALQSQYGLLINVTPADEDAKQVWNYRRPLNSSGGVSTIRLKIFFIEE